MKKLIGLLIAFSLVFTMFSCYISAGEEYLYQTGVKVDGDSRKKCTRCGLFEGEEPPEISEPDPTPPDDPEPSTDVPTAGDIDGDTVINAKDALVALKVAVGKAKLTEAQKAVADVNKDGQINAKDALEILKYAVGKPSVLGKK